MDSIQLLKNGLDSATKNVERTLDGLTMEEINWHPRPDANSIGLILFHMARSEDSLINGLIQGKNQLWETAEWYKKLGKAVDDGGAHYSAEQVEKFVTPDMAKLKEYSDAVRKQTLAYLDTLTPAKLDDKVTFPEGSKMPFEPIVGILVSLTVNHAVGHAGEISYIRGLKRGMDK
jgi:uncharacterized damage-inducible protein DinB